MNLKDKAAWKEFAMTAANWYVNTQCSSGHPWGGIDEQADEGRFVYEVYKASRKSRGSGIWAQAMAIMDLIDVGMRNYMGAYSRAGLAGARYLLSLQNLDCRHSEVQGAFWEHFPLDNISLVRDSATGAFGLAYLYAHTGEKEYLERLKLYCDWLMKYGTKDEDCWPYLYFDFKHRVGHSVRGNYEPGFEDQADKQAVDGDWQAGGGLALYYAGLLSGEKKYLEAGFKPMVDKMCRIYDEFGDKPDMEGWHGHTPMTFGNDDFALIALIAAFRYFKDERYLEHIKKRTRVHLGWMHEDGSYPNFGATFVCSIEHMEYLKLAEEFGFSDMADEVRAAAEKSAAFGLTLQERDMNDPLYYGGLYGQTSYGVARDRIHHRSTGYAINFYLKIEGEYWPRTFSSYGWGDM